MTRTSPLHLLLLAANLALSALGCQSGGVGDPCIPEDEYKQTFNGYAITEVNIESKSFQCETRVCIVNHFAGRVSCPYGQTGPDTSGINPDITSKTLATGGVNPDYKDPSDPLRCRVPGTDGKHCIDNNGMAPSKPVECNAPGAVNVDEITVPVDSQKVERNAQDTVYCSCRCKGPDTTARYCECPSGYQCSELVRELGLGAAQLAGSYCIKNGTAYNPQATIEGDTCHSDANMAKDSKGRYDIKEVCGPPNVNP